MVLILDGNSEIGSNDTSDLSYPICLGHLFRSRSVRNLKFFFSKRPVFFHTCATCLSYHLIKAPWHNLSVPTWARRVSSQNLQTNLSWLCKHLHKTFIRGDQGTLIIWQLELKNIKFRPSYNFFHVKFDRLKKKNLIYLLIGGRKATCKTSSQPFSKYFYFDTKMFFFSFFNVLVDITDK